MKEIKKEKESHLDDILENVADKKKREFIKKFGKYAASAPLAGFALMTPSSSLAAGSGIGKLIGRFS